MILDKESGTMCLHVLLYGLIGVLSVTDSSEGGWAGTLFKDVEKLELLHEQATRILWQPV